MGETGQLGNGAKSNYNYPQMILDNTNKENGVENIKKVGSAERVTFLITDNNEVYATGENSNYQLSQNHNTDLSTIEKLYSQNGEDYITDIINVTSSCKNINNTAVIKKDGTVWVAGLGANGQVGNGQYQTAYLYTRMGNSKLDAGEKIVTLAKGETHHLKVSVKTGFNVYEEQEEQPGKVTYTSGTPAIAAINAEGVITALEQGETRIFIYDETNLWSTSIAVKVTRDQTDVVKAELAAGTATIILKTDGTVLSIGKNDYGQRGVGNTDKYVEETQVLDTDGKEKLSNVKGVSAGSYFATAVKEDGRVVAWGQNNYGQLGNGTNTNSTIPTYVVDSNGNELTGVIKVVSGSNYSLALKANGTVWSWGYNKYGQLGNNTGTNSNVAVQVKDPTGLGYLKNICDISVQAHTSHALTDEGEVYGWGYNYHGQIGDGTRQTGGDPTGRRKLLPVKLSINNVTKLVGGYHHTMALKTDGTVWTWGLNRYGTLGYAASSTDGNSGNYCKATPMQVKLNSTTFLTDVVDIGTAYETSFATTSDGTIYGWGYNNAGQLGTNNTTNYNTAQLLKKMYGEAFTDKIVGLSKSTSISTNYMIREDGIILGHGYTGEEQRLLTNRTANVLTVTELRPDYIEVDQRVSYVKQGSNITLQASVHKNLNTFAEHIKIGNLSWSSSNPEIAQVANDGTITAIGLGETTITVKDINHGYQAQAIVYVIQNHEQAITMPDISQGTDFSVILKADGSVWTTGINNNGQCGDGTTINRSKPVRVKTSSKEYLSNIVKIAAGTDHVIALSKEGEVYAWGLNDVGQLGNGGTTRSVFANKVLSVNGQDPIKNVIDISSGHKFSLMLLKDGTVWGIGRNAYGELGTLNNTNKSLPVQMDGIANAIRVQANSSGSSVQIANGTVWTTGYNYYGTLGQNGTNTGSSAAAQGRTAPNPVINNTRNAVLKNVTKLVAGLHHNIVLQEDHTVWAWGYNHVGQYGTGNTTSFAYPVRVKENRTGEELADKVVNIGASGYRTILQTVDENNQKHTLIAGYNNYGQIGNNTTTNATSFIPVNDKDNEGEAQNLDILPDDSRATNHTGYIDINGTVWTVGYNNYGQLGDDTVYQRKNIVQVGETALKVEEIIFTMNPEDTKQIKAYIEDTFNVYIKENEVGKLKFESLDTSIAEVNETGLVTAKGIGDTLVRVIDIDKNIQSAVYVKVIKKQEDMQYEPMVDGGSNHSVALKGDGTVWTWGYNKYGQLGNNATVTTEIPVQVKGKDAEDFLTDIQMIASGTNHVLALKADGTVWAWGYNNYGQLGDNTQITRYTPVQVLSEDASTPLTDIIYIAAGANFSVAVNKQGEVWSWGQNDYGQLGDGSKNAKYTPTRVKANLSGIIKVACGMRHTVALKADGSVYSWGDNTNGQLGDNTATQRLIPVKVLETTDDYVTDALSISTTNYSTHILKANGTVISVGLGTSGQLGNGGKVNTKLPVIVSGVGGTDTLTQVKNIKSGANTTYALRKDGTVASWGLGTNGELGNETSSNSLFPVEIVNHNADGIMSNILYIGAGANHGLAVEDTGYVEVWGLNNQKQIGDVSIAKSTHPLYIGSKIIATPSSITMEVGDTENLKVSMESFNLFRAEEDLNRKVTYESLNEAVATVSNEGIITAKGMGITTVVVSDNLSAKVTTVEVSVLENGAVATPKVVSGLNHTVALKADGTVWTWGYNHHGQLGNGTVQSSYIPEKINLTDVIDVAAGDYFSMALKKDGSIWAWGYNDRGQLAQDNKIESLTPVPVKGVNGNKLPKVTKIAASRYSWIALLETGEVVGCGANTQALLGDGTTTDRLLPVYMLDHNGASNVKEVKDISIGQCESLILKEDGTLWSVGHNCNGGMGVGNTTAYAKIRQVQDTTGAGVLNNIIQISSGGWYSLALDANGNVWAFGRNDYGQLGINNTTKQTRPQKVVGVNGTGYLSDIVRIEAGYMSSFAVDRSGNVYGWGYNNNGQLGINNTTNQKVPKQVLGGITGGNLNEVMLVSSNGYHSTFVKYDGTVWTTGFNNNGELGNDSTVRKLAVECISYPKLDVDQKYLLFGPNLGETKKITAKPNGGFNLLTDTVNAGANTFASLNTGVATVDQEGIVTSTGSGTTYIKITNDSLGLTTTVKVTVPARDGITTPKIVGGANHYVALKADGTVWTWGLNTTGQLGLGDTTNRLEPVKTNMTNVIDVAAGNNFTAVLKKDGTVWVTGQNNYGQLGQNNTTNTSNFVQVKSENGLAHLEGVIAITAVNYHMAALKADGTVVAWGYNNYGQLGNNTTATAKLPTRVRRVNNIMDIAAGGNFLILLDSDGTVWATGHNNYGQLGQKNTTASKIPVKVLNPAGSGEMTNVIKVEAGANHTVLLSDDGKVYSVGYNNNGQLAIGNTTNKTLPVEAKEVGGAVITNAADIIATGHGTVLLRKDGSVYTAGYNGYGQAGNGTTAANKFFTKMLGEYGEGDFTNVLLGASTNNTTAVADNIGRVYVSGYNAYGQIGDKTTKNSTYLVGISHTSLEVKEPIMTLQGLGTQKQIESKLSLGFNILYNNLETETYTYRVLNKDIATVDQNGVVTGLKYGSTSIEVTNQETGNKATVILNVVREGDIANPKVVSGVDYNIALKSDGTVWSWGYNNYGELGLGDSAKRLEPTKVNIEGIIDIAAGNHHTLLLKQDGTVWAMGLNNYGQIGNNTTTNVNVPTQVQGLESIIKITAGANHSVALKSDGTAYSWGYNNYGQLGDNTTTRRSVPVEVRRVANLKEISAGNHSTLGLDTEGNVWVWGLNTSGQLGLGTKTNVILPTKLTSINQVAHIDLGTNYGMAVTESGEVYSFGVNESGQLGIGNKTNQTTPKQVVQADGTPLTNIEYVSAGTKHVLAKTKTGLAYGWGLDSSSQLGDDQTANKLRAVPITYAGDSDEITAVLEVSSGNNHSVLVREDGTVWTVGKNNYGQIGDETTVNKKSWVCISDTRIKVKETSITIHSIGGNYTLSPILGVGFNLLYDDGEDGDFAYASKDTEVADVSEKGIITGVKRGKTKIGITETNTENTVYVDVYVLDENDVAFPQIVTREATTVALKADGTVWTWGQNNNGQLGLGDTKNRIAPTKVAIEDVVKIATSGTHTLALKKDGSLWAWGAGTVGQLGNGILQNSTVPVQVKDETGMNYLSSVKEIATSTQNSMAVTNDGKVYSWGLGTSGQIGNGAKNNQAMPTKVNGLSNITKIAGGNLSCYAITDEGEVYAWGYNNRGQLGDGTNTLRTQPVKVPNLTGIIEISASNTEQVLALKDDGTVWGWGYSNLGALTDVGGSTPKQIAGKTNRIKEISGISAGYYAGLAITDEGKVLSWGTNGFGGLGNGTTVNTAIPKNVMESETKELDNIFIISMGKNYSVYAKEDGSVWATGTNEYGQLGNTSTVNLKMPENISNDSISTDKLELIFNELNVEKPIGTTYNLGFNLYNNQADVKITYTSDDDTIAAVGENGMVTSRGIRKNIHYDYSRRISKKNRSKCITKPRSSTNGCTSWFKTYLSYQNKWNLMGIWRQ